MSMIHTQTMRVTTQVQELVLELTRRCNMACAHCLRGDAQVVDMTPALIEKALEPITYIETLTFTGGEPSLVPHLMQETLSICKERDIQVGQVYLATNGKEVSQEFIKACLDWHTYTFTCLGEHSSGTPVPQAELKKTLSMLQSVREMGCWVALSMDEYHEPIFYQNLLKLAALPHLVDDKHHEASQRNWIIPEGNAASNGLRSETMLDRRPWMFDDQSKKLCVEADNDPYECNIDMVYVNARGKLLKYCDYSYALQKEQAILDFNKLPAGKTWLDEVCEKQQVGPFDPEWETDDYKAV